MPEEPIDYEAKYKRLMGKLGKVKKLATTLHSDDKILASPEKNELFNLLGLTVKARKITLVTSHCSREFKTSSLDMIRDPNCYKVVVKMNGAEVVTLVPTRIEVDDVTIIADLKFTIEIPSDIGFPLGSDLDDRGFYRLDIVTPNEMMIEDIDHDMPDSCIVED